MVLIHSCFEELRLLFNLPSGQVPDHDSSFIVQCGLKTITDMNNLRTKYDMWGAKNTLPANEKHLRQADRI